MIKVSTIGFDDLAAKFRKAAVSVQDEVAMEVQATAKEYEGRALKSVPVSNGALARSIHSEQAGTKYEWDVYVGANYAPFVEFGTKGKYSNPGNFPVPDYAKGSRTMDDFIRNLTPWAERTGYLNRVNAKTPKQKENAVRWLAIKILKNGLRPQPFFYVHYNAMKDLFRNRLERVLNNVTK